jgi:hypothetical protein
MDDVMNNNAANKLATKYLSRIIFLLLASGIEFDMAVISNETHVADLL